MIGSMGIYIAFAAVSAAAVFFLLFSALHPRPWALTVSRYVYAAHAVGVSAASIYLLYALLAHKFQYYYVFAYTERTLELKYLISAFWAGQEGTLLLWALIGALIGLVILRKGKELQAPVMTLICTGQFFLLLFLVVENPFRLLPQLPSDGVGLNPLLLDPWMAIHPPVIFIGYALFLVPYAFAAAALWKNNFEGWVDEALPWSLVGWLFLGAGIFIGGYWAYRVLGWGGYWSWDPVENASLVPWLTGAALVHVLLLQKRLGRVLRSSLLLAVATYVLIIYATFLTRSGVLADFSVHSFAETPLRGYLVAFMLFFLVAGLGLFAFRCSSLQGPKQSPTALMSPYWLYTGGFILFICAAGFVALGTSSPVITALWGQPSAVDESFYTNTNAPLAVLLLLLLGLVPYLLWKKEPAPAVLKRAVPAVLCGFAGVACAFFAGIKGPFALLFVFAAVFAFAAALQGTYQALQRGGLKYCGGHLAHAGVALMLLGVLASMGYTGSEVVGLTQGSSREVLGYNLTYVQKISGEAHEHDELCEQCDAAGQERDIFEVTITRGNERLTAYPQMYTAGREARLMREPFIKRYWWGDLYLSPLELQQQRQGLLLDFAVGKQYNVRNMDVFFSGFEVPGHGEKMEVGALLEISHMGETYTVMPVITRIDNRWEPQEEATPEGGVVLLEGFDPDEGRAHLRFISPFEDRWVQEVLMVELSRKPLISVLAAGTLLIMAGTLVAFWRRLAEKAGRRVNR